MVGFCGLTEANIGFVPEMKFLVANGLAIGMEEEIWNEAWKIINQ